MRPYSVERKSVREVAYVAKKTPCEGGGTQGGGDNGGGNNDDLEG